jgi:hypothetical protein
MHNRKSSTSALIGVIGVPPVSGTSSSHATAGALRVPSKNVRRLKVRTATGQLRVVAVWQLLQSYPSSVEEVVFSFDRRNGYEEMTVSLAATSSSQLREIVARLVALPWVLDACFYP